MKHKNFQILKKFNLPLKFFDRKNNNLFNRMPLRTDHKIIKIKNCVSTINVLILFVLLIHYYFGITYHIVVKKRSI